jgi:hypothetical protein
VTVSAAESPKPETAAEQLGWAGFPVPGTALAARRWRDRNGLNLMVVSQTIDHRRADGRQPDVETLHVLLVGDLAGRPRLLRAMRDPSGRPCPLEFGQGIAEGSIGVTDTDHDGVGEVSVGWFNSCRSDVGQYRVKLALLTGSTKLILRGQGITARGRASIPEAELAGYGLPPAGFTPEPSGEQWPPGTYDDTVHLFHTVFS